MESRKTLPVATTPTHKITFTTTATSSSKRKLKLKLASSSPVIITMYLADASKVAREKMKI